MATIIVSGQKGNIARFRSLFRDQSGPIVKVLQNKVFETIVFYQSTCFEIVPGNSRRLVQGIVQVPHSRIVGNSKPARPDGDC